MLFANLRNGPKNCVTAGAFGVCVTAGISVTISEKVGNVTVMVTQKN